MISNPAFPFPAPARLEETLYPPTSRYHGIEVKVLDSGDGEPVAYLGRRFVPSPDRFETLREYSVSDGDRLDLLAFQVYGDAEQFWRLCDANFEMNPHALTATAGQVVRITLPEGMPGTPYA